MNSEQLAQLKSCIPTLQSEYLAACYMVAVQTKAGSIKRLRREFLEAFEKIDGVVPPMAECVHRMLTEH